MAQQLLWRNVLQFLTKLATYLPHKPAIFSWIFTERKWKPANDGKVTASPNGNNTRFHHREMDEHTWCTHKMPRGDGREQLLKQAATRKALRTVRRMRDAWRCLILFTWHSKDHDGGGSRERRRPSAGKTHKETWRDGDVLHGTVTRVIETCARAETRRTAH